MNQSFTVGIDVSGSQLFAQVLDAKFAPHPGEVVGGHRVVRVELAAAAVFEMLEPPGYSVPACGRLNGCARGDVAEYADGFIERRAVLTVEHGMDERGCHLWRNGDRKSTRLNSVTNAHLVCRLLLEKKKKKTYERCKSLLRRKDKYIN